MAGKGRKKKKCSYPRGKKFYVSLAGLIIILFLVVWTGVRIKSGLNRGPGFFRIKNIELTPFEKASLRRDMEHSLKGNSIFSVDLDKLRNKMLSVYPEFRDVRVYKQFPDTIKVVLEKRRPFFQIKCAEYYVIDRQFRLMSIKNKVTEDLPVVDGRSLDVDLSPDGTVKEFRFKEAGNLLMALDEFEKFSPKLILAETHDNIAFFIDDTKIIIGSNDFEKKLKVLNSLAEGQLHYDFSSLKYIDLRYSKVYIGKR